MQGHIDPNVQSYRHAAFREGLQEKSLQPPCAVHVGFLFLAAHYTIHNLHNDSLMIFLWIVVICRPRHIIILHF